jgi:hypothetical protein
VQFLRDRYEVRKFSRLNSVHTHTVLTVTETVLASSPTHLLSCGP